MSTPYALQPGNLEQIRARITGRDQNISPATDLLDSRALLEAVDYMRGQQVALRYRMRLLEIRTFGHDVNAWVRAFWHWVRGIAQFGMKRESRCSIDPGYFRAYHRAFRAGWRACERGKK